MIISLQGSKAVGKTSLLRQLSVKLPEAYISYEHITDVSAAIAQQNLSKDNYDDYQVIQGMWIDHEIHRYQHVKNHSLVLMDFGAEEIDFYTRFYPKSCGKNWEISPALQKKLELLQPCLPDLVIFLDATDEELRARKLADTSRKRSFFDYQLEHLLPLKKQWFLSQQNTIRLDTSGKPIDEVLKEVLAIVTQQMLNR